LYELVRGLNTHLYTPIVFFQKESRYHTQFEALGAEVVTLQRKSKSLFIPSNHGHIPVNVRRHSTWLRRGGQIIMPLYQLILRDWPLICRIARLIRKAAVDLVHHNNNLPVNRAAVIAACLTHTPQICHVRWFNNLTFVDKWLARCVEVFIYNSRAVAACYHYQGIALHKGQVVYNPINTDTFMQATDKGTIRAEFGLTMHDVVISNVGLLASWKGQDYFLEALAQVVQTIPQLKALIVGPVDPYQQHYYKRLKHLVASLELSNTVIFTGFRADIPRIMASSDIIVHSASEPEPFGRVIAEAMVAGTPVIATAAGGVLEIVQDQVDGLLVPPQNAPAMAKALLHLLNNPEQARLIAQRAQQHARKRFSVQQHVDAVQRIYQHVLTQ
jgi:glycosyltransferase involved in cell wall biosynthesis